MILYFSFARVYSVLIFLVWMIDLFCAHSQHNFTFAFSPAFLNHVPFSDCFSFCGFECFLRTVPRTLGYCQLLSRYYFFFPFCLYQQFTNISGETLSIYLFIYFIYSFISHKIMFFIMAFLSKIYLKTKANNGVLWPSELLYFAMLYYFKHAFWIELVMLDF